MAAGILTQDRLKELLHYDPETGVFTWVKSRGGKAVAGVEAGALTRNGYVSLSVCGGQYLAHRLAFLYMFGVFPHIVDHINRERTDNRICNLRSASRSENAFNSKVSSRSATGATGVSERNGKFRATLKVAGVSHHVGWFTTVQEASRARKAAEVKFGVSVDNLLTTCEQVC